MSDTTELDIEKGENLGITVESKSNQNVSENNYINGLGYSETTLEACNGCYESPSEILLRYPLQRDSQRQDKKCNSTGDLKKLCDKCGYNENCDTNMVLQLVLPNGSQNSNQDSINYLTTSSLDSILGGRIVKERPQRSNSTPVFQSNQSPSSVSQTFENGAFVNYAYTDSGENGRNYSRISSVDQLTTITESSDSYKSTPPDEKRKAFWDLLTKVLSGFYALFNITLGLAVYVTDIIEAGNGDEEPLTLAENFSLFLMVVAFLFILYLTIDISIFMRRKRKYDNHLENDSPDIEMKETMDGNYHLNIIVTESSSKKTLKHHYCLNRDKHSANFYLKLGAAGFCFGHLIHSGLVIGYRFIFLTSDYESWIECGTIATLILDVIYPFYSFLLLFFIFKYSNIIINRHVALARFGIMHCLSSSLCFWVWTIIRETLEYISINDKYYDYDEDYSESYTEPYIESYTESYPESDDSAEPEFDGPLALPLTSHSQKEGAQILNHFINATVRRFTKICNDDDLSTIYKNYSPYLYPFSVEYSILVVGVLYIVWQNIGICNSQHNGHTSSDRRDCRVPKHTEKQSNVVVHADCHAANKGIFGGFIVLVFIAVSIILFFIVIYENREEEAGFLINRVTSLVILTCMTISVILAYKQITKLDISPEHHNNLDNLLLFVCLPAFFLHGIFSIIPAIVYGNIIAAVNICLEVFQVLMQTVFIVDGLRRSSNTKSLRNQKPGRELVTFLVICNVATWIMQTFEVKSHSLNNYIYDFYSKVLWAIIGHMCLPFMMFYRFHSSVCIGDIWKHAYEPPGH